MARQRLWTQLSTAILRRTISSAFNTDFSAVESFSRFGLIRADFHVGSEFQRRRSFCSESVGTPGSRCWNCGGAATFLVCQSCQCVQPVDNSVDYFKIFGLENKFDIEGDENLEKKYKDWQKKLHPDLVHSKSEKEREYAAEQSARVIDAYRTLNKPLSRALYILKLEGVSVDEEETISELDLLGEIMEIREAVEEASDSQALINIQSEMQEKLKHWSNLFANAFRTRNFGEAVKAIRRMTYYERVKEEIALARNWLLLFYHWITRIKLITMISTLLELCFPASAFSFVYFPRLTWKTHLPIFVAYGNESRFRCRRNTKFREAINDPTEHEMLTNRINLTQVSLYLPSEMNISSTAKCLNNFSQTHDL